MPPFQDAQRVRKSRSRHTAPRISGPANGHSDAANRDCRQREWFVDAVVNAIIRRIDRQVRRKCDVNAVESQARLVTRTSSEGMGFTEREHLALYSASVSEAR